MSPLRRSHLPSLAVKGLGLVAVLVLVWCAGNIPVHASECALGVNTITIYYSSAAHTTIVGTCSLGPCPPDRCSGKTSDYVTVSEGGFCEICVG
jgi:hypothetical protein